MPLVRPRTALTVAGAALSAVAVPAPAVAGVRLPGTEGPLRSEQLSDEFRVTRWAHVDRRLTVRSRPSRSARRVGRLRWNTEDGKPEVYLVLRSHRRGEGVWLQVRIPGRPNGRVGWVPRSGLGRLRLVRTHLRVNRRTLRATLYRDGRRVWRSPIGVGKRGTPTPGGRFWIRERLRGGGGIYGPWAFGTAAYSRLSDWPRGGVVGIHGTNRPDLIPGRPSHGCIRVPNPRIRRLARILPVGTPVRIL